MYGAFLANCINNTSNNNRISIAPYGRNFRIIYLLIYLLFVEIHDIELEGTRKGANLRQGSS